MREFGALVVTCEHASNTVPTAYSPLFKGSVAILETHRGYDLGALALARGLARHYGVPLHAGAVSRLVVELNRSLGHPVLFSEFTKPLPRAEKDRILEKYYRPYREAVSKEVEGHVAAGRRVLHLSVHSFTPELHGEVRNAEIGLLYHPRHEGEKALCLEWQAALRRLYPGERVRRNYPYRGAADGFTTWLRRRFPHDAYFGIELETNQRVAAGSAKDRARLLKMILDSLSAVAEFPRPAAR
jgi:predicted N-formylglutamate amidohydrolase